MPRNTERMQVIAELAQALYTDYKKGTTTEITTFLQKYQDPQLLISDLVLTNADNKTLWRDIITINADHNYQKTVHFLLRQLKERLTLSQFMEFVVNITANISTCTKEYPNSWLSLIHLFLDKSFSDGHYILFYLLSATHSGRGTTERDAYKRGNLELAAYLNKVYHQVICHILGPDAHGIHEDLIQGCLLDDPNIINQALKKCALHPHSIEVALNMRLSLDSDLFHYTAIMISSTRGCFKSVEAIIAACPTKHARLAILTASFPFFKTSREKDSTAPEKTAATSDNPHIINLLVDAYPHDESLPIAVPPTSLDSFTEFLIALFHRRYKVISSMLQRLKPQDFHFLATRDDNAIANKKTYLMFAVMLGDMQAVTLLVKAHIDSDTLLLALTTVDSDNNTAEQIARKEGFIEIADYLKNRYDSITNTAIALPQQPLSSIAKTPTAKSIAHELMVACSSETPDVAIEEVLNKYRNDTALMTAAINHADMCGHTPLMLLCKNNYTTEKSLQLIMNCYSSEALLIALNTPYSESGFENLSFNHGYYCSLYADEQNTMIMNIISTRNYHVIRALFDALQVKLKPRDFLSILNTIFPRLTKPTLLMAAVASGDYILILILVKAYLPYPGALKKALIAQNSFGKTAAVIAQQAGFTKIEQTLQQLLKKPASVDELLKELPPSIFSPKNTTFLLPGTVLTPMKTEVHLIPDTTASSSALSSTPSSSKQQDQDDDFVCLLAMPDHPPLPALITILKQITAIYKPKRFLGLGESNRQAAMALDCYLDTGKHIASEHIVTLETGDFGKAIVKALRHYGIAPATIKGLMHQMDQLKSEEDKPCASGPSNSN